MGFDINIFLSKITIPAVLLVSSAWIIIQKDIADGILFMFLGFALMVGWFFLDKWWLEYKHLRGIR